MGEESVTNMNKRKNFLLLLATIALVFFGAFAIKTNQMFYLLIAFVLCVGLLITYYFWKDN